MTALNNASTRTRNALFTGALPAGDLAGSYVALVLSLVAELDDDGSETNDVDNVLNQLRTIEGDTLAVQDLAKRLNSRREQLAR